MSGAVAHNPRRACLLFFACLTAVLVLAATSRDPAGAAPEPGRLAAEPVLKSAAAGVTRLFGASPGEAQGEVWGSGGRQTIARYTDAGGWEKVPPPVDSDGSSLSDFELLGGALAGRATPAGGVAVAALVSREASARQALLIRDPGGQFRATPEPGEALESDESLFRGGSVLAVPIDEPDGRAGAFVVPSKGAVGKQMAVLHFDGTTWSREEICREGPPSCAAPPPLFRVLAIDATGPGNAWLLGQKAVGGDGVELFRREAGKWRPQTLGGPLGTLFGKEKPIPGVIVLPRPGGQPLTVTQDGLWVDASIKVGGETLDATFFYRGGQVEQSWCDAPPLAGPLCGFPLGAELQANEGRSFAWSDGGLYGRRVLTGIGQGALLSLVGNAFERVPLAGGRAGAAEGAALSAPDEGWLGGVTGPLRLTRQPAPSLLKAWPVPFRRPLTAIAPEPGAPVASLSSEALAVGDQGQVARYVPSQGWVAESLLNGAGKRVTSRLRGVAWPRPGFAYAVGDDGAIWLWRAATGLWEPDPGAPPNLIRGNFTGIAFDPGDPDRGYAVGKQGLLLAYGREWAQEPLPPGVPPEANFTSISFAGHQALATYRFPLTTDGAYTGGLLVNDGSGWRVDPEVGARGTPVLVAGLPDGGAAVAYEGGLVVERNGPGAPWTPAAESAGGSPSALAAIREAGAVRAVVSISPQETNEWLTDREQVLSQPPPGQAPLLIRPYALPPRGYLERQTANGWRDEQHEAFPIPTLASGKELTDLPREPDPLLALLMAPDGSNGWAIGGETGERVTQNRLPVQTAAVVRYGTDAAPPRNFSSVPIPTLPGVTTLALGGNAQCAAPCADQVGTGVGPEAWLPAAVGRAAATQGVRAFIYTGAGVAGAGAVPTSAAFAREEAAYARRLGAAAGHLPVFSAPAASDRDRSDTLATFASALQSVTPVGAPDLQNGYYAFDSPGGGSVRVLMLDYSRPTLDPTQRCWLAQQLEGAAKAGKPAIVVGNRDLGGRAPEGQKAADAGEVIRVLVGFPPPGCAVSEPAAASAYFFDFPEENRAYRVGAGGRSIPTFGSGTLGYVNPGIRTDFLGASGFLLAQVGVRDPATNVAPVNVRLIPNIGELALEASDGTLLRRSSLALFRALARRPRGGGRCVGVNPIDQCEALQPDPYVPIPARCQGANCASGIFPEYRFVSSRPDIADFVKVDAAAQNPRAVLLGGNDKPIPDPTSGLLCAFNAGTTTVTIEAGGLAYSTQVTVQGGGVQRPCGTVPLRDLQAPQPQLAAPPPPPAPSPAPEFTSPGSLPPPAPPSPAPAPPSPQPAPNPAPQPSFFAPAPALTPVVAIVPPPPPPTVQTTPPSGTSPVTQPAVSPEPEEEEEAAFDLVHHMTAYRAPARRSLAPSTGRSEASGPSLVYYLPALIALAALAGAGITGSRRRSPRLAYAPRSGARRPRR
jgi:hypothetical protein